MVKDFYCGNNSLDADVVSGIKDMGTRYGCFKKGVGVGKNQPLDVSYLRPYAPIDTRRIYCGNKDTLPAGYDSLGNLNQCLVKGIGVGKKITADEYKTSNGYSPVITVSSYKILYIYLFIMIVFSITVYSMYRYKKKKEEKLDKSKRVNKKK